MVRDAIQFFCKNSDFVVRKMAGPNGSLKEGVRTMQALYLCRPFWEAASDVMPMRKLGKDGKSRRS
ncbi:hypothetical protein CBM2598_U10256 [Cupriavidus taiwanensis]|uniref:Uncharacterized protein n=1 Tax=Cupriavidus taiwanensis TaxID=164546 RepID=A0A7Z7JFG2_9BURK|nr:hypothetical protein CBM2597_U10095 [Cupriavidus taiwanensis]SOZ96456.1 hypothetical protein CBM2598_U10256 [Cupriavidus taiwanensis]SPC25601.1 hypothetical protein CBM2594_U10102 [Cupriavidus taiwanensis]